MAYLLPPIDAKDLPLIVESWAEILAEIPDGALQGCYISAMLEKVSAAGVKPGALRALDVLSCWKQIEADSIKARMVILQEEKNREDLETVRYIVAFLKISHSHDPRYGMNELRADVQQRCQNARISLTLASEVLDSVLPPGAVKTEHSRRNWKSHCEQGSNRATRGIVGRAEDMAH